MIRVVFFNIFVALVEDYFCSTYSSWQDLHLYSLSMFTSLESCHMSSHKIFKELWIVDRDLLLKAVFPLLPSPLFFSFMTCHNLRGIKSSHLASLSFNHKRFMLTVPSYEYYWAPLFKHLCILTLLLFSVKSCKFPRAFLILVGQV